MSMRTYKLLGCERKKKKKNVAGAWGKREELKEFRFFFQDKFEASLKSLAD